MRKKHVFSLFIAVALCLIPAYATESVAPTESVAQASVLPDTQNAYSALMDSFGACTISDSPYVYNYPSYYGGSYTKDNVLYVNLTSNDASIQQEVLAVCDPYSDVIRFRIVPYSMTDLLTLSREVYDASQPDVISTYVDEERNCVVAEVDETSEVTAVQLLSNLSATKRKIAYHSDMIVIQQSSGDFIFCDDLPSQEISVTATQTSDSLDKATYYAYGGSKISDSSRDLGSLGACGTYNTTGVNAFVTAGHLFNSTGTTVYIGTRSLGTVVKLDKDHDYAIIKSNGNYTLTNRAYLDNTGVTFRFPGVLDPETGATIQVYGAGTGMSRGEVSRKYVNTGGLYNLIQVNSSAYGKRPGHGDSGAPVTVGLKMIGTVTGITSATGYTWYLAPCTSWDGCFSLKLTD
ncbi:MAG: hypothetical protein KH050_11435 [Clostridiaceae bacterium]|nr:hypothetical protein [Clostridiaceae bacterium]